MKKLLLIIVALILLLGCATLFEDESAKRQYLYNEIATYDSQKMQMAKEGKIKYAEAQKKVYDMHRALLGTDAKTDEFYTYAIMVYEKVDNGEIKPSEADYLVSSKQAEIAERRQADAANRQSRALMLLQYMQNKQALDTLNKPKTYTVTPSVITPYSGSGYIIQEK